MVSISFVIFPFGMDKPHSLFFMMYFVIFIVYRCFNIKLLQTIIFVFCEVSKWCHVVVAFFLAPPKFFPSFAPDLVVLKNMYHNPTVPIKFPIINIKKTIKLQ